MGNAQRTAPATPKAARSYRNQLIGKVKMACKQLGIEEDDYKDMLLGATGHASLTLCNDGQIVRVIELLKSKGFRQAPSRARQGQAQHPVALKARAMWLSLYQLGVVRNPSEQALEKFACGQLKCARFAWARQSEGGKVIEALKDMAIRNGWVQVGPDRKPLDPLGLQESLCTAIVQQLQDMDVIPADWTLSVVAHRMCNVVARLDAPFTAEDFKQIAASLGSHLRRIQGERS